MLDTGMKICAAALLCTVLICVVKQAKEDMAVAIRACVAVCLLGGALTASGPVIEFIRSVTEGTESQISYVSTLIKALGIAMLTHVCASVCRECGEGSAAYYAELGGRIEILILSLPLVTEILDTAKELVEMI